MHDYVGKARACLDAYLERGKAAAELLDAHDADGAVILLRKRAAAFHNFRSLDVLARRCGVDIASEPDIEVLLGRSAHQSQWLASKLASAREEAEEQIAKLAVERRNLRFFRTGAGNAVSFERLV